MGSKVSLPETLLNMRMTSRQLKRMSTKCEQNEVAAKKKAVEAMTKGNLEGARIYAANAIREKQQALNFLRLSSRIDGVAARVDTAIKMGNVSKLMGGVVDGMDVALKSMDTEKISKVMDKFESQFETVDVRTAYMDAAMDGSLSTTTPIDQVDSLMMEIGSEANINVADMFARAGQPLSAAAVSATAAPAAAARTAVPLGSAVGAPAPAAAPPAAAAPPSSGGAPRPPHGGDGGGGGGLPTADPASDLAARLAALKAK